eukprot:70046_1
MVPTLLLKVLLLLGLTHDVKSFTACNNYRECESVNIGDKQFTCWGHESCTNAVLTGTDSMPRYLDCVADASCESSILDGFQYAYCQGKNSCHSAQLSADHIECGGYGSCQSITDTITARNVYCEGTISCSESDIKSGVTVNCNANKACFNSKIQSKDGIFCNGINSCANTQLQSKMGQITCNGKAACRNSRIDTQDIKAYGQFGAAFSVLTADKIHAMGYYSLLYANIDSLNRNKITVKMYGSVAGYGATMLCQQGSICTLDCKGTGCLHMELICFEGSDCNVLPADCISVQDVDCPVVRESLSIQQDIEFMEYIKQKKNEQIKIFQLYVNELEGNNGLIKTESGKYDLFDVIFKSVLYSNIFTSCVVFVVTLIISVCYYRMKYKDSIYKQIHSTINKC